MWEEVDQVFASRLDYTLRSNPSRRVWEDLVDRPCEAKVPDCVDIGVT